MAEDAPMSFPTLMVYLVPGGTNDPLLRFAADLAGRFRATRVIGIAACQPLQVYGEAAMYVPGNVIAQDRADIEKQMTEAEGRFRAVLDGKAAKLDWRSSVGHTLLAEYVSREMRAADLLVAAPDRDVSMLLETRKVDVADVVLRAGRPVLVVPPETSSLDLKSVVVAWKESREARRALADALPLLGQAERTTVVEVAADDELPAARSRLDDVVAWLGQHGIAASSRAVAAIGDDATRLATIAEDVGAGLVIGGAYGHNRLREWVLGGVTRDLLLAPTRCSFVSH
jgi:nucleotide-binding universal stress UspA family protein